MKYIGAKLVCQLGTHLVFQVARIDGPLEGPDVTGDGKVVAHERDVELLHGLKLDGMSVSAAWTAKVLEDDDGDLAAGGRTQDGGVAKSSCMARPMNWARMGGAMRLIPSRTNEMRYNQRIDFSGEVNRPGLRESRSFYSGAAEVLEDALGG